ncbi:AEC family transporter [Enterovirga rhinocerotis]|uniref:AEC family transporter n=1 Tax=Enterovirga rhinocerotis TaxID=1339210 RepID=A0A4R7BJ75_9HYPH|nr:AEC family transporter [Enterovirga rhinocerotis]TDR85384.1 hypothetical protein EV668_4505 [Enterovirga rhinocerotis]
MAATVTVVFPIFAVILIGWLARRVSFIDEAAVRGLREVAFRLVLPALLFSSMISAPPIDLLGVATVYFGACFTIFAIGLGIGRLLGLSLARSTMLGLNACYGNTLMVGVPVSVAAFGTDALPPILTIIALHSGTLLPLAGVLIEADAGGRRSPAAVAAGILKGAGRNPVILAILAAFLWRATGVTLPAPFVGTLKLLGAAGIPLALLVLGASLPPPDRGALGIETVIAVSLKLLALPALVFAFGSWAGLPSLPLAVATLAAATPTGANAFLLAHRNDELIAISAGTVLVTTVLSVLTLGALVAMLG